MNWKSAAILVFLAAEITASAQQAALKGIEVGDLDRSVKPCDDFFTYSNGTWRAQNPIPPSMDRWSRRWKAGEDNKDQLRKILEEVSAAPEQPKGTPAQLTGDFYAACTNVKAIDAAGVSPLKFYLSAIDAIQDAAGLQKEILDLQAMGVRVPFAFASTQHPHDPSRVIADVSASGLGMPDRDYYVKTEKRFEDARAEYLVYVAKIFTLAGAPEQEAKAAAQMVMTFETALAKASLDNVALRDPHAIDHVGNLDALQKMTPHFDWTEFVKSTGVARSDLNVQQPAFMAEVERQLASTPPGGLEDLLALAVAQQGGAGAVAALRRCELRVLSEAARGRRRAEAARHPLRRAGRLPVGRSAWARVREALLPARSERAGPEDGGQHPLRDARHHRRT